MWVSFRKSKHQEGCFINSVYVYILIGNLPEIKVKGVVKVCVIVSLSTLFPNLSSQSLAAGRPSRCCPPPAPQVSPGVVDYACTQASLYMLTMLIILPHTLSIKSKRIGDTDYMPPRISTILILLLITSPTWSFSTTCWSSFLAAFTSLSSSS